MNTMNEIQVMGAIDYALEELFQGHDVSKNGILNCLDMCCLGHLDWWDSMDYCQKIAVVHKALKKLVKQKKVVSVRNGNNYRFQSARKPCHKS